MSDAYIPWPLRYRPQKFSDLVGQDQVNIILKGIINSGRIPNALLFAGPRGSGKTSSARVFSKALNCTNRKDADPCDECAICKSITNGTCIDVVEQDAASRGLVDDVRSLKQSVLFSTVECKFKLYIMDEVHAMSRQGFDAMLKLVEETPPHVKFIFCTTEAHRIPETIISRTLRFDFKRLSVDTIVSRLKMIAEKEGVKVEDDEVFNLIARHVDGGLRDAVGKLEQVSHLGEVITVSSLTDFLGVVGGDIYVDLMDAIINKDVVGLSNLVKSVVARNADLSVFVKGFGEYLHRMIVAKLGANVFFTKDKLEQVRKQLSVLDDTFLFEAFDSVTEMVGRVRRGDLDPKLEFEVGLMRLVGMSSREKQPVLPHQSAVSETKKPEEVVVTAENAAAAFQTRLRG